MAPTATIEIEAAVKGHAAQAGLFGPGRHSFRPPGRTRGRYRRSRTRLSGRPVVAAAVILPAVYELPGLTDSKALSAKARDILAPRIRECALAWGLGVVWPRRIERINILQATFEAMSRAVGVLRLTPGRLLIDGNKVLPDAVLTLFWRTGTLPRRRFSKPLWAGTRAKTSFPPPPSWLKPFVTGSCCIWAAAGPATAWRSTRATAQKPTMRPCAVWAPARSTA